MKPASKIRRGLVFILGMKDKAYPWHIRLRIAYHELANLLLRRKEDFRIPEIDDSAFLQQLADFPTLRDFYTHIRRREKPVFFYLTAREAMEPLTVRFESLYPRAREQVISGAGQILDHVFDLLGSGPQKVSGGLNTQGGYESIGWQADFKSGYRWDKAAFSKDIKYGQMPGVDVKVPWELSRCQHFPALGKAYHFTGDEKYAREFVNEVDDWINNNPVACGVNWACTMDVAIRAVNWFWGLYFFRNSPTVGDEFLGRFLKSLYVHGQFIMGNLEKDPLGRNSNHYLSDLAGLVYLGVLLPELKDARRWRDLGIKEILAEAKKQLYPDGVDYEGSISYHRLAAEIFLSVTMLCMANNISLPEWYLKRLEKMLEFVRHYTRPDGKAPQIGDNDDGRLSILADYDRWDRTDHRYLLATGAALFNRPDFKQSSGGFQEEAFWLLGEEGRQKFEKLTTPAAAISSAAYASGGFYIMRKDPLYLITDCVNPDTKAPSGHRHNSRLSFELYAYDKSFIIDPGTYLYTSDPAMRNIFRSTAYHNTVVVDGEEQNKFSQDSLFMMGLDANITVHRWRVTDEYDILDAEHNGYQRLTHPVIHRRQVFFNKVERYWIIRDILSGQGRHKLDMYFHFAPMEVETDRDFPLAVKTRTHGANLAIIPLETAAISVAMEKGWVSFSYGVKTEAPVVKYSRDGQMPAILCNILYPYETELDIKATIEKVSRIDLDRIFGGAA
jgi:hypothetical protein